jgi:hypothetical protein
VVVGRICSDVEASSSKLAEGSIMLESSRMLGSGTRVLLRFSPELKLRGMAQGISGTGLFPGAIVALKGRNGGGNAFVVEEILGVSSCFWKLLDTYSSYISILLYPLLPNQAATKPSQWLLLVALTPLIQIWTIGNSIRSWKRLCKRNLPYCY